MAVREEGATANRAGNRYRKDRNDAFLLMLSRFVSCSPISRQFVVSRHLELRGKVKKKISYKFSCRAGLFDGNATYVAHFSDALAQEDVIVRTVHTGTVIPNISNQANIRMQAISLTQEEAGIPSNCPSLHSSLEISDQTAIPITAPFHVEARYCLC